MTRMPDAVEIEVQPRCRPVPRTRRCRRRSSGGAWVSVAGLLANAALWLGVLGPVVWRRFERRFPVR